MEVVKILLERSDVNPDTADLHGQNPLEQAVIFRNERMAKLPWNQPNFNFRHAASLQATEISPPRAV